MAITSSDGVNVPPYTAPGIVIVVPNIPTASLPTAPSKGTLIYDATTNKLVVWTGAGYETVTSA